MLLQSFAGSQKKSECHLQKLLTSFYISLPMLSGYFLGLEGPIIKITEVILHRRLYSLLCFSTDKKGVSRV